jgi:hypothetical protein
MEIARRELQYKIGDVFGFLGKGSISRFINLGTYGIPNWGLSHVAIVGEWEELPMLFESTTLTEVPCYITGEFVKGVQAHTIGETIERYDGRVWHYPLYRVLYNHEKTRLRSYLMDKLGTPYDAIGAVRSGGAGFSWLESRFRDEDLSSIFCSELLADSYGHTGIYPFANSSRWNPNSVTRHLRGANVLCKPVRKK